jgi:hypothetical protein
MPWRKGEDAGIEREEVNVILLSLMRLDAKLDRVLELLGEDGEEEAD